MWIIQYKLIFTSEWIGHLTIHTSPLDKKKKNLIEISTHQTDMHYSFINYCFIPCHVECIFFKNLSSFCQWNFIVLIGYSQFFFPMNIISEGDLLNYLIQQSQICSWEIHYYLEVLFLLYWRHVKLPLTWIIRSLPL